MTDRVFSQWFPLNDDLVNNDKFRLELTPLKKLTLLQLISLYNLQGGAFYIQDAKLAAMLVCSVVKVRKT